MCACFHLFVFTDVAQVWEKYGMDNRVLGFMKQKGILVEPKEFDFFVEKLPDEMEYKAAVKTEVQ